MESVVWFKDVDKGSIAKVGGKGANLGEMVKAGFPVPDGFIVTAEAYHRFVNRTGIQPLIIEIANNANMDDAADLKKASDKIKQIMLNTPMLPDIAEDIKEKYAELCKKQGEQVYVAVRSSATAEDLPTASFAGQQATFLDVQGDNDVIKAVRLCWASLYTPRAIFYRTHQGFRHDEVLIAVPVQKMVKSEVAGVVFTAEPTGDTSKIIIEAGLGLGETVVGGKITPDRYVVDKEKMEIVERKIGKQGFMIVRNERATGVAEVQLTQLQKEQQKLSDGRIIELAKICKKIEDHYAHPQDIEWGLEQGTLYILQSRNITTLGIGEKKITELQGEVIVKGLAASPGIGKGKVVMVHGMGELPKVASGTILVTAMTNPDMVPAMRKAEAIVTNDGGITCHAAIVSRELGVPCIVGTDEATEKLTEGEFITVDAYSGTVFRGDVEVKEEKKADIGDMTMIESIKTKTKIYVNLGLPEKAEEYSKLNVDGVGLMREEFIIATEVKEHPLKLLREGRGNVFVDRLVKGITEVAKKFHPRPVVLRLSDLKTNEYRGLVGGEEFEEKEDNPMLGWRGCSRYYSGEYLEAFKLELQALKKVREEYKNVWVMLPFVRTIDELKTVEQILSENDIVRGPDFKLWIMAEVPSNALLADEFADHCDGFSIGSNDLTQLVLGVDRDSEKLGKMGLFNERDPAVKKAIKMIIDAAHRKGKTVSICGQAPSNYPEFTEWLVAMGIDSISVNADVVNRTRDLVSKAEKQKRGTLFGFKLW